MTTETTDIIETDLQARVGKNVQLLSEGAGRYQVFTPFHFDDGDHLAITMRRESGQWIFSDEGNTFMHLTYDIDEKDLQRGARQRIIGDTLEAFGIHENSGELRLPIQGEEYGNALFTFIQAILKITDVSFLSRERVRSTFMEDFKALMRESVPEGRLVFDYFDRENDKKGKYPVDCKVNGTVPPLFVFAISNDDKCRDSTITMLQFERWQVHFRSMAVFEEQEDIRPKVLARFSDVCDKLYSSLNTDNVTRIKKYLGEFLEE